MCKAHKHRRAKHTLLGKPYIDKDRDRREHLIERETIDFM